MVLKEMQHNYICDLFTQYKYELSKCFANIYRQFIILLPLKINYPRKHLHPLTCTCHSITTETISTNTSKTSHSVRTQSIVIAVVHIDSTLIDI